MLTVKLIHNSVLSIQFNFRDKSVFEECKRRCKQLGATWNAEAKAWIVSAHKLDVVIDAFPKASYAYEVFGATSDKLSSWALRHIDTQATTRGVESTEGQHKGNPTNDEDKTLEQTVFGFGGGYDKWVAEEERRKQMIRNRRYGR